MMPFLLLQKLARVPLKNLFRLAIIVPGKCKYIFLIENVRTCNYLQCTCKYILHRLSEVFAGYPWLFLDILGYPWISLVNLGYYWLSKIQIYVKLFAHLQLSFPSFAEIFCSRCQIKLP